MATVDLYTFEDADGCEQTFTTFSAREAKETADHNGWLCFANEYEYSDRDVAWDFRPSNKDDELEGYDPLRDEPPIIPSPLVSVPLRKIRP